MNAAIPSFVRGRRGGYSLVDALVRVLWPSAVGTPAALTIAEMQEGAKVVLAYDVPASSVRSALYSRPDVFERTVRPGARAAYRLTPWALEQAK